MDQNNQEIVVPLFLKYDRSIYSISTDMASAIDALFYESRELPFLRC